MSERPCLVVVGTRPEAVKLAPVVRALRAESWVRVRVVATAQHRHLLDRTLNAFDLRVDRDLDLMQGDQSPTATLARTLAALEPVLVQERPAFALAQGDTTTVLATALACAYARVPFAHVEAGLRTGDRSQPFPEELHRELVSRLAALHFAPTEVARDHLVREGVPARDVHVVGNPGIDALLAVADRVDANAWTPPPGQRLLLATAHRRESFGAPMVSICRALRTLAERSDVAVVLPVHPNPAVREVVHRELGGRPRVRLVEPLDYPDMVALMRASHFVLTDSGGVQEEAPALAKPVLVLRHTTERAEGVAAGASVLVGTDERAIVAAATRLLDDPEAHAAMARPRFPFGRGDAAARIAAVLRMRFGSGD